MEQSNRPPPSRWNGVVQIHPDVIKSDLFEQARASSFRHLAGQTAHMLFQAALAKILLLVIAVILAVGSISTADGWLKSALTFFAGLAAFAAGILLYMQHCAEYGD